MSNSSHPSFRALIGEMELHIRTAVEAQRIGCMPDEEMACAFEQAKTQRGCCTTANSSFWPARGGTRKIGRSAIALSAQVPLDAWC
jgi:hypothetical protein